MKAINRQELVVNHLGAVAITVSAPDSFGRSRQLGMHQASLLCISCDVLLQWQVDDGVFVCPSCDYDMTSDEAVHLCKTNIKKIKMLCKYIPGRRTIWSRLFGG